MVKRLFMFVFFMIAMNRRQILMFIIKVPIIEVHGNQYFQISAQNEIEALNLFKLDPSKAKFIEEEIEVEDIDIDNAEVLC